MWKWTFVALVAIGCSDPEPEAPAAAPEPAAEIAAPEPAPAPTEQPAAVEPGQAQWSVALREGENMALLATWADTTPEALLEFNGLPSPKLRRAQSVKIPGDASKQTVFEARRAHFVEDRLARFIKAKGEPALAQRKVRRGDSLSRIAARHRLPLWVLIHYNAGRDLDRLNVGDSVTVPTFGSLTRR